MVGSDDHHHGGLRPLPQDAAGEADRGPVRPVRGVHHDPAHTNRGQQLLHLLQQQVSPGPDLESYCVSCPGFGELK